MEVISAKRATLLAFAIAYIEGEGQELGLDPHTHFSVLLGISRDEAKELCYKILFDSEFLKTWKENV